jgi:hypothetical protein
MDADTVRGRLQWAANAMYDERATNDERRQAFAEAENAVMSANDSGTAVVACVSLMQDQSVRPESRSFAASIIGNLLRTNRVGVDAVPYEGMAQHVAGSNEHRLVLGALAEVLARCAEVVWPAQWDMMLDTLCPVDLAERPGCVTVLEAVVDALFDPDTARIPSARLREIRPATDLAAYALCERVVNAIGQIVTGSASWLTASEYQGPPVAAVTSGLLKIVELVVVRLQPAQWWQCYCQELIAVMLGRSAHTEDVVQGANIFAVLVSAANGSGRAGGPDLWAKDPTANQLMAVTVDACETMSATRELWGAVEVIADAIVSFGPGSEVATAFAPAFANLVQKSLLPLPSTAMGVWGCTILNNVLPVLGDSLDIAAILQQIKLHIRKFVGHPVRGWDSIAEYNAERYGTAEEYDEAFGALRGQAGMAITTMARGAPAAVVQFIADSIAALPPPTDSDPRNSHGHIDQRSPTYVEWEVLAFMMEAAAPAVADPRAVSVMQGCFGACFALQHKIRDATLVPVLLNISSALWAAATSEHWGDTLTMLFRFMALEPPGAAAAQRNGERANVGDDPDTMSARKRAMTLLIRACTEFGAAVAPASATIVQQAQQLLIANALMPHEAGLLYESMAALSNHVDPTEQYNFLEPLIRPQQQAVEEIITSLTPQSCALMICGDTRDMRNQRSDLRNALGVLTSVLKRCNPSALTYGLANALLPAYTRALELIMEIGPFLPRQHAHVVELDPKEKKMLAGGGNMKPPGSLGPVSGALYGIKQNLFSGIASMVKLLGTPPPVFNNLMLLLQPVQNMPLLPAHHARQLCTHCLFEVMDAVPQAATAILPAVGNYIEAHSTIGGRSDLDEAAEAKLIAIIYRAAAHSLKAVVLPANSQLQDPNLFDAIIGFYLAVIRSGYETRTVVFDVIGFTENPDTPHAQAIVEALVRVVHHPRSTQPQRKLIADKLADVYVKHFPRYAAAAVAAGVPQAALDQFHSSLTASPRADMRRKRMADLLANVFGLPPIVG